MIPKPPIELQTRSFQVALANLGCFGGMQQSQRSERNERSRLKHGAYVWFRAGIPASHRT
eukprot:5788905-Amphidinium_carterae.1